MDPAVIGQSFRQQSVLLEDKTIAYDVTYRYDGQERTIRMDEKPGDRLPVIDGQVVTQVASLEDGEAVTRQ